MNKLKKLIGVILCALLVTGCELKYEGQVEITSDGKMDMSIIMAYDRELVSTLIYMEENDDLLGSENGDDTDIPEASITNIRTFLEKNKPEEQEGIEVSRYEKNGYYGYQMTYEIENIDDVSTKEKLYTTLFEDLIQDNENNSSNSQKKMMFQKDGDIYSANIKLNETSDNNINANLSMVGLSLKYTVTLPTKPIEHNADTVSDDGKTLSWNISSLSEKNDSIEYSFKLKDAVATAKTEGLNTEMIMLIAGIVIIVIIIVIVLVLFARNNKKLDKSLEALDQTIPSAAPKPNNEPLVQNTPVSTQNTEQTPVETTPTTVPLLEKQEIPTQASNEITENVNAPIHLDTVPVVENIPVSPTQTLEQNVTAQPVVEIPQEVITNQPTQTPNLEEMPIIMEPSVAQPVIQNTQAKEPQNEVTYVENVQETIKTNEIPTTEKAELEVSTISDSTLTPEIQIPEPTTVIENIEVPSPAQEEVITPVPETNIFDVPSEVVMPSPVETKPEPQPQPTEQTLSQASETPITNETPAIEQTVISEPPVIEIPTNTQPQPIEISTNNEVPTTIENLENQSTSEPVSVITEKPVEEEQPIITEQVISEPITPVVNEQPKLEVLETNNTTLEEPDTPLPEPIIETQVIDEPKLEEAPVIEEPTGNRFIQTDFIENRTEESQNNNTNI